MVELETASKLVFICPFPCFVSYSSPPHFFHIFKFLGTVKQESVRTFVGTFTVVDQREQLWISCEPAAAATLAAQWISISQDLTFWRTATAIQWVLNLYCISFDEFLIGTVFYSMSFESVMYLYFYFFDLLTHTHLHCSKRFWLQSKSIVFVFAIVYLVSDTATTTNSMNFKTLKRDFPCLVLKNIVKLQLVVEKIAIP